MDKPGTPSHVLVRDHLEAWAHSGSVDAYGACYADWLGYLDRVPFHRQRTKPILDAVGLTNGDIGGCRSSKAPMPAGTSPNDDDIDIDIDATWKRLSLIRPAILKKQVAERARIIAKLASYLEEADRRVDDLRAKNETAGR